MQTQNEETKENKPIVRTLSEDASSDDTLNNIVPMAPLGLYGAIGGKECDNQTTGSCKRDTNEIGNLNFNQSKEVIGGGGGIESNSKNNCATTGIKHHLPFSSRSNGISNGGRSTFTTPQPSHQQDLVSYNASMTSMTSYNNSGRNYTLKLFSILFN